MKRLYALDAVLASQIAERRRKLGWSQNRLGLASGFSEAVIAKAETLRSPITPAQRQMIEVALAAGERARQEVAV